MNLNTDVGSWQVDATDPLALTTLLDLSEFTVTRIEYDARLDGLIVLCDPAWAVAVCPPCHRLTGQVH